jgi:hypothetical protein
VEAEVVVMRPVLPWIAFTLVAACGAGPVGPAPDEIAFTTPIRVTTDGAVATASDVRFEVRGGVEDERARLSVPIDRFDFVLTVGDDRATVEKLEIALGDMNVPPTAMPPIGLPLRDLALGVTPPVHLNIVERKIDLVALGADLPLRLAWELELPNGTHYPLGVARTAPLPVDVVVARDGAGDVGVTVDVGCKGVCWELPGIVTVKDLWVHAEVPVAVRPVR